MRLGLAFVLALSTALPLSPASAQASGAVIWLAHDASLASRLPAVRRGLRRAIPSAPLVRADGACDPSGDPACVVSLLRTHPAARLLVARVIHQRGPCVPVLRDGVRVGSRMLQDDVVALELYRVDGSFVGSETVSIDDPSIDDAGVTDAVLHGAQVLLARWP